MEQRDLFDEPYPVPVCFLQLVGKQYPLEAVRTLEKKREAEQKNLFRQNLLGGIRPFSEPIQFFVQVQVYPMGSPRKGGVSTRAETDKRIEPGKVRICF